MSVNDPIADMLTRVRNSVMTGQSLVAMPSSKIKVEIARILKEEGYIEAFEVVDGEIPASKTLRLRLKYVGERRQRRPVITGLERISRPGRRIYTGKTEIPWVLSGHGHCHPLDPQGCHDRAARAPAGRGR
jgi:small subunit ribosomal protein S8